MIWRPAIWSDIEPALSLQPNSRSDDMAGAKPALSAWRHLFDHPFFLSAVLEATPPIHGHRMIGFGCAALVTSPFAEAEIANPQPDITSRIIVSIDSGNTVLATRNQIASDNAGKGISVVILYNAWRDSILNQVERNEVQALFPSSLAECLAGFRVRRLLAETTSTLAAQFYRSSVVWQSIAEFPGRNRVIHLMTAESAQAVSGSLGNVIFRYHEPVLRLRESDQALLLATLEGSTDGELADRLGITFSAVKARWRSIFARVSEVMPSLLSAGEDREGRGSQKRHTVITYVRSHPEELRPYEWKAPNTLKQRAAQHG